MGRTLPSECEHGYIFDWGDFGPDPDDGSVGAEHCFICEGQKTIRHLRMDVLYEIVCFCSGLLIGWAVWGR